MSDRHNKYRWLELAFSEHIDRLNESFYFDRKNKQFFSVFITDYFLTDSASKQNYPDNPYSVTELATLSERIDRLEHHDLQIVPIPRLTVDERIQMIEEFFANRPHIKNHVDLQKMVDSENGRTNLDFDNLLPNEDHEEWNQFKSSFIEQKIDRFCNLQSIDLDTTSLWTDRKMTTISFDLSDEREMQPIKVKKPWWKFW